MRTSFDEVFASEFGPLYGYVARRLGASVADDLTAETFAIAFRRWEDLDPARPVRPWLYGIASNLIRHEWRKERRMLRALAAPVPIRYSPRTKSRLIDSTLTQSELSWRRHLLTCGGRSARFCCFMPGRS